MFHARNGGGGRLLRGAYRMGIQAEAWGLAHEFRRDARRAARAEQPLAAAPPVADAHAVLPEGQLLVLITYPDIRCCSSR
jgi:phage tail protein X